MGDAGAARLRAALICERVHADPDGALSAVRLLDRITVRGPRSEPAVATLAALVVVDGGGQPGGAAARCRLRMRTRLPSGGEVGAQEMGVRIPAGEVPVAQVILDVRFEVLEQGLHWLLFSLDDAADVLRVPLLVGVELEDAP